MGGDRKYRFSKSVWSPSGGWWPNHPQSKTYRKYVFAGIFVVTASLFALSANRERRSVGYHTVPSQRWCKHTLEDDPNYLQRRLEEEKKSISFWKRIF